MPSTPPAGARLLLTRIRRRVRRTLWLRRVRRGSQSYDGPAAVAFEARLRPDDVVATFPGPSTLPAPPAAVRERAALDSDALMQHRFHVFGTTYDVTAAQPVTFDPAANDLPRTALERYRPIDWHTDFASGYRWEPAAHYLDIRVAPVPGADIKVPRELSRFQHVGALAWSGLPGAGEEFLLQVLDWIAANPPGRGVNWASAMDVSIRAVNWIWGFRLFATAVARYPAVRRAIRRSLHAHGVHIAGNLEYYEECTTNHYLADIAGLIYIGAAFPEFPESDLWLRLGIQELVSEADRQLYDDGADFEASTSYHRLVVETFLSCAALIERLPAERRRRVAAGTLRWSGPPRLQSPSSWGIDLTGNGTVLPARFYERIERAVLFTRGLMKPDGRVPQFGDNDSGRLHKLVGYEGSTTADHRHLLATAARLLGTAGLQPEEPAAAFEGELVGGGLGVGHASLPLPVEPRSRMLFHDAGIAVMREGLIYAALTCGRNGQHGRGGHGHNDKLSLELTIDGVDVLADGGCPSYTGAPDIRNRFRSTAAHSTVWLVGHEQDVWKDGLEGLFRLPERSSPRLQLSARGDVAGSHDGFGVRHQRTVRCEGEHIVIEDLFPAAGQRVLIWNLAPGVAVHRIDQQDAGTWRVRLRVSHLSIGLTMSGVSQPHVTEGFYAAGYGQRLECARILATMRDDRAVSIFRPEAP